MMHLKKYIAKFTSKILSQRKYNYYKFFLSVSVELDIMAKRTFKLIHFLIFTKYY